MADDSFTETTSTGWFSRIGNSIKGVLFGIVLLLLSVGLLWWNEGRSVKTAKGLAEGAQVTVEAEEGRVDAAKEGKLVHVVGKSAVKAGAKDDLFGVTGPDVLKLKRRVEIFQWVEDKSSTTRKKLGGSEETVTEYRYHKKWDDKVQDSSHFHHPQGHENPKPSITRAEFLARDASLGAYRLPEFLLAQWNGFQAHDLPDPGALPKTLGQATVQDKWIVLSSTPADPVVGDVRVQFESIKTGDASVLARQVKDTFEPYVTSYGTDIARIASGVQSKDAMFAAAEAANKFLAWLLRVVGFVLMFMGFIALTQPLKVLADVVPFAGSIVGAGTGFVSLLLSAIGSFAVIAMAWVWYRPVLGITLLLLACGGIVLLVKALRKKTA
jgi:hypothetical protein